MTPQPSILAGMADKKNPYLYYYSTPQMHSCFICLSVFLPSAFVLSIFFFLSHFSGRFQVWMCGGQLMIATCSHVGHVFRKSTPYTFPGGTSKIVNHNNARLAEVWLDDWKEFYFSINPGDTGRNIQGGQQIIEICIGKVLTPFVTSIKLNINFHFFPYALE